MVKPIPEAPSAPSGSLAAALEAVPDPRRPRGWRPDYAPVPLVALLQATVAAVLCGARSLYAVAQWVRERREDDPELLEVLGFPSGRHTCVATLHRVYKALDVAAFERAVGAWLAQTGVAADDPIALDGKTLRGVHGHVEQGEYVPGAQLVAAYAHGAHAVLAQLRTGGKGQELAAVGQVLAQVPLAERVVTGDALLTQREVCAQVVAGGGDYVLPVKGNQPALRASLAGAFSPVGGERPRGHGAAGPAGLVRGRTASQGRRPLRRDGARREGAARAAGGSPPLGGRGPVREPLRRQPGDGRHRLATPAPGLPRRTSAGGAPPRPDHR